MTSPGIMGSRDLRVVISDPSSKITQLGVDSGRGVIVFHDSKSREIRKLELATNVTKVSDVKDKHTIFYI